MIPGISKTFLHDKPVIYADLNVFRYIAYNELHVVDPERFIWVYSLIHLDEMLRNGNTDALEGMRLLKAREVKDILNDQSKSIGDIQILQYVEPTELYESYVETVSGTRHVASLFIEPLLTIFGADNQAQLAKTPQELIETMDELTSDADDVTRDNLMTTARQTAKDLTQSIHEHLNKQFPIDDTRKAIGMTSGKRKSLENEELPIEAIWELIEPAMDGAERDVMLGLRPNPLIPNQQFTQHGAITKAHTILNLIGYSPDKSLSSRKKIKNILSDADHVGMAAYCQALLSADKRLCNKARAIYKHIELPVNALHFDYDPNGCEVDLEIRTL